MPSWRWGWLRTAGSGTGVECSNSSALTPSARASAGMWSSASRRLPASRRDSVETSMCARSATCARVSPRRVRSSRSRRRTRASTDSFACMANHLAKLRPGTPRSDGMWDCIIVGGGAAGLSAALTLGRARRKTLVIDAGEPEQSAGGRRPWADRPRRQAAAASSTPRRAQELEQYTSVEFRRGDRDDRRAGLHARRRAGADRAAGDRHGVPLRGRPRPQGALWPVRVPLPVLPRVGAPRRAARRARRPRARRGC